MFMQEPKGMVDVNIITNPIVNVAWDALSLIFPLANGKSIDKIVTYS